MLKSLGERLLENSQPWVAESFERSFVSSPRIRLLVRSIRYLTSFSVIFFSYTGQRTSFASRAKRGVLSVPSAPQTYAIACTKLLTTTAGSAIVRGGMTL